MSTIRKYAELLCEHRLSSSGDPLAIHVGTGKLITISERSRQEKVKRLAREVGYVPSVMRKQAAEAAAKIWRDKYEPLLVKHELALIQKQLEIAPACPEPKQKTATRSKGLEIKE